MFTEVVESLSAAFGDAVEGLIVVALRGGLLFWGVLMGRVLGTALFEPRSWKKVAFISMPIAVIVAAFFGFYSFKWVVNPGETKAEAIHDAEVTFFCVLLPLCTGCIWGL
jgi:hypothetical protein